MFHLFKKEFSILVSKKLVVFLWLICFFSDKAQVYYSTDPLYLKSKPEQNNLLSAYRYTYPDTSITEVSNYFPRNFMGNMGLASPTYLFKYGSSDMGFKLLSTPLENDKFSESQIKYYRSKGPYANLNGIAGSKEFQIFKMLFTHTYKDKVNLTIGFNRYTSKGFYLKQQTYTNNFYLSSNYTTKSKKAGYYLYLLNNGNKNQENGGIKDGRLTDSSLLFNKQLFPVKLSDANRDNREFKVMINPWLRLNRSGDSTQSTNHYLQLKSAFSTNSYRYKDVGIPTDHFYKHIYLDTVKTIDSTHVKKLTNELAYSLVTKNDKLGFSIGYKNELNQVWQHGDSVFMNHIAQSDLVFRNSWMKKDSLKPKDRSFETRFNLQYVVEGSNKGNYKAESNSLFTFNTKKQYSLFLNLLYENRNADYMYNNWISNHFYWFNNGYTSVQQMQLKFGIHLGRYFSASVFNQTISNYLYFDQEASTKQYTGSIQNTGLNLNFTRIFFKHVGVGLNYLYQNTSNTALVRVPQNTATFKLFYNGSLAKNNLLLQIGAQVQGYDAFYAYSYMPSTQTFYLQDTYKTDLYPYVDVYLNARIRPVTFFLKLENVLQGLSGPNYALVPGYYQTDRAFRFGLTWMFFD